jgi:LDH2 family malate/lactate/ureidoglycolate dehydrogenase
VRFSNHHGTLGYFTRMAAESGCIGVLSANGSPAMAPWGGRKKIIGNNPWSIATPAGRHAPMMLDIANTVVARGKIFLARQKGHPIPLGWAMDAEGRPTTDPVAALSGVILPMAEHKGYAISLMMDVLSGVLSGSGVMTEVNGPYQAEKHSGSGHFVMALDIARFGPLDAFEARVERMIAEIKATPRAEGFDEIFYPGEIEARNEARHLRDGLDLPGKTLADLAQAGAVLGVGAAQDLVRERGMDAAWRVEVLIQGYPGSRRSRAGSAGAPWRWRAGPADGWRCSTPGGSACGRCCWSG